VIELSRELQIAVVGHLCVDLTPQFEGQSASRLTDIMRPGRLNYVGPLTVSTGGAVSNVGISLARLGANVKMMAKVGDDSLGATAISIVGRYSSDVSAIVRTGDSTSYSVVLAPPGTDRIFFHHPGCNDTFSLEDIDLHSLSECCIFHFGYPTLMRRMYRNGGEELTKVLQAAKQCGVTVSLDMAMFDPSTDAAREDWRGILLRSLPSVDVFLPSLEECVMMMRPEYYARFSDYSDEQRDLETPAIALELAREFVDMGVAVAGIKCGALGYCVVTGDRDRIDNMGRARPVDSDSWSGRQLWSPGYWADTIKSATGAGDSSIAGFLMSLACGQSIETASNAACAVGWQNLRAVDAFSGVGTWQETLEMIEAGRPRNQVRLPDGWRWCSERGVWTGPLDRSAES